MAIMGPKKREKTVLSVPASGPYASLKWPRLVLMDIMVRIRYVMDSALHFCASNDNLDLYPPLAITVR